jgi:hypothetical protein
MFHPIALVLALPSVGPDANPARRLPNRRKTNQLFDASFSASAASNQICHPTLPSPAGMSKIPTKDLKMSEIPGILSGYTVV